jgi:MFS transporter, PCFT/HCP family, solute carrier family 46 (folate transporter), member 1
MGFASLAGASVGPAMSSGLMEIVSPWTSALVGFFAMLIGPGMLVFIPDTFHPSKQDPSLESDLAGVEETNRNTFQSHIIQSIRLLRGSLSLLYSPSIVLVLATFLTRMLEILATSQFLGQYVSKRFHWPLAKTGYLITIRGIIHMVVLLVVLPLLSNVLLRWQPPAVKDLTLARISAALVAIGAMAMASSKVELVVLGLVVESLGPGLSPLCRSLATSFVASQDTSKLNTIIGIVETIGSLFAGPVLAWLFELGMKRGGLLLGLPYFGLAGSFLLCLVGLFFVQSPQRGMYASDF